ncbi:hypothetical protein GQ457_06G033460 [Hibiscus cannabinus]
MHVAVTPECLQTFDETPRPTLFSYNMVFKMYTKNGFYLETLTCLLRRLAWANAWQIILLTLLFLRLLEKKSWFWKGSLRDSFGFEKDSFEDYNSI